MNNENIHQQFDFNFKNKNGETALHLCCKKGDDKELIEVAKYLVLKGRADINVKNNIGDSPVELA